MGLFKEVKDKVTVRQAAEYYGLKPNRSGMIRCICHEDKNPSLTEKERRIWSTGWHLLTIMITPKSTDFTGIVDVFCKCKHDIQENLVVITGIEIHRWWLAEKRR